MVLEGLGNFRNNCLSWEPVARSHKYQQLRLIHCQIQCCKLLTAAKLLLLAH